jgi:hypothetical protein
MVHNRARGTTHWVGSSTSSPALSRS